MRVLYISTIGINLKESNIYSDLIGELLSRGHSVTLIDDARNSDEKCYGNRGNFHFYRLPISVFSIQNRYLKGITALFSERLMLLIIKKYLADAKFDLLIYATPPIMYTNVVAYCKNKYQCLTYLMLKDIFPQNAADESLIKENGLVFRYFRRMEKKLYRLSDFIGCMSKGNMKYVSEKNQEINCNKIELFPNSIKVKDLGINSNNRFKTRSKYSIPEEKTLFIFGGNLGIAQGIRFLIDAIASISEYKEAYFLIVGKGSEVTYIKNKAEILDNVKYISYLNKDEYDALLNICDVGIISLGGKYTIPNYPSRTLAYMQSALPILAITDSVTDIRNLIETDARCGLWSLSGDFQTFKRNVELLCRKSKERKKMGINGYKYLKENFDVSKSVDKLESHYAKYKYKE